MRYVDIGRLGKHDKLGVDVVDKYGRVLLTAGQCIKSKKVLKRLIEAGITAVIIEDDWSEGLIINDGIGQEVIDNAMQILSEADIDEAQRYSQVILDKLLESDTLTNDVYSLRKYDENTYQHSINVSISAITMGIGIGLNYERLKHLAAGSLLHDIGKQVVPKEIINKPDKLTKEEYEIVKEHSYQGYLLLCKNVNTSSQVREIAHQHHERFDGFGYPRGLQSDKTLDLAAITHICDVWDALISKRSYKNAFSYRKAVDIMIEGRGTDFDPFYLDKFFRYVPIYNVGTQVKTNTGQEAIVIKNNRGNMLKPVIKFKNGDIVDLSTQDSIEII